MGTADSLLPVGGPLAALIVGALLAAAAVAAAARLGHGAAILRAGVRAAALEIARPAASSALVPALDQTRTVGLVTLPGAFVGMLLGGASPLAAGAVQLFVLVALLLVESAAIGVCLELVARGFFAPRGGSDDRPDAAPEAAPPR